MSMPDDQNPTGDLTPGEPGPTRDFETLDAAAAAARLAGSLRPGDAVGPYLLVSQVGEGGFGEVWLAERREPMVQRVAIKIIKPGMDSKAVVARFEQERQALARMDHPNVARVFDGGATATGRPYFVMEFVEGETLTAFADRKKLTLRERLELFIPVCEAVQHAHHKGLVHRDLKPSNVLVAEIEGKPVPKVIDFGVAKAISSEDWAHTAHTQSGMVIGTPAYMSPEQVAGELDVDTRADVYSLGVMLYELLAGEVPFDPAMLRKAALAEIQRVIREVAPPKPSTRIAQASGERTTAIAQSRSASRERLTSELRRELDWIPLMALRKERERRYASPQALADDLRRYLDGRPLRAAPDSRAYLARKFVRRNKVQVAAAAAVFLALGAGLVVALWQRNEAIRAKDAEAAQRAEAESQRTRADERAVAAEAAEKAEKERADQLKKVSDFQSQMLSQIDATQAGIDLMKDVRERFVAALEKAGMPEKERTTRVDALQQELVRVNATDAAAAMIDRTILKPAIKTIDEQFKDDPATDASLRQALADLYRTIGLYDAAFPLQESALANRRRTLGEEHPDTLGSINNMGMVYYAQGNLEETERCWIEALERRRRVFGADHSVTVDSLSNLGGLMWATGRLDEAETYWRETLERRRRTLGDDHRDTLAVVNQVGMVLWSKGKFEEAEPYLRESLEGSRRLLGEEDPDTLFAINNLAVALQDKGKLAEAEALYREALEKRRRVLGEEHPDTIQSIGNMAVVLLNGDRFDEAEPFYREALEKGRRVLGEDHPETLAYLDGMGVLFQNRGQLEDAEPYWRQALERRRALLGEAHPDTLESISSMGVLLESMGKHAEALELLLPVEASTRGAFTGGNARRLGLLLRTVAKARTGLGYDAGRYVLAESNLLEAYPIFLAAKDRGPTHKDTLECAQALVDLYTAWNTAEPGKGYDTKAAEWQAKLDAAKK